MSNWNKVNSEMYSLTDSPYHCIVRESGQMYYCEVFRNDDLILVSTVKGLQAAKNTCEVEILADLQKRGLFAFSDADKAKFNSAAQEMYDALWIAHRYSNPRPILFNFKDTGGKEDAIKRHAQAAKAVEDGCKAATEQEPKYKWKEVTSNNHSLKHGKFYAMAYSVLGGGWSALVKDEEDDIYVLNELTDTKQNAKEIVEQFLKGYYEGPEAKLTHEEPKHKWKEPRKNSFVCKVNGYRLQANLYHGQWWYTVSYATANGNKGWRRSYMSDVNTKLGAQIAAEKELDSIISEQPSPTEVEETVIAQIRKRRDIGRKKYGTTMERKDLSFIQWLQHLQEELLDAAIYAEKLKREHRKGLLSDMIADDENSGLYEA